MFTFMFMFMLHEHEHWKWIVTQNGKNSSILFSTQYTVEAQFFCHIPQCLQSRNTPASHGQRR